MASTNETTPAPEQPKKRNRVFPIILIAIIIAGAWFGISKYTYGKHHEDTDDAQVSADISPVIPRVGGYVKEVKVKDNQFVKKGDTLIVLDDRDLQARLNESIAALEVAKNNLNSAQASTNASRANIATTASSIGTIDAQIAVARVNARRANEDYQRYANLIKDQSITQQQFEQARAAKETADKQVQVLEEQRRQAQTQTSAVAAQSTATSQGIGIAGATIHQREAEVESAKLNLSYTVIVAPEDGIVSKVPVQEGQFVQPGQSLFSIVHNNALWVTANFKETQLNKMNVGQKAVVKVDALNGHEFEGKVASFSPATGSTFALLPPDNASGNFVKTVQRLPVKIVFDDKDPLLQKLRPGMNVQVDVNLD